MLPESPPGWALLFMFYVIVLLGMLIGAIILSNAYKRTDESRFDYIGEYLFKLVPTTLGVLFISFFLWGFVCLATLALKTI